MPRGRINIDYEFNNPDMSDLGYEITNPSDISSEDVSDILTKIVSMLSDIEE